MKKLLIAALLLGLSLGIGFPVQAEDGVVADGVITLDQGDVWSPECGVIDSGLCGYDWGTNFGSFLGEATIGFSPAQGGVLASTIGFGGQERWEMDALAIIATPQSHAPVGHLLTRWVIYGVDLWGRPWKAQVLDIGGEQITLHVVVYPSVVEVLDPEYFEGLGVSHWVWLVRIPENFWNRLGVPGALQVGEFSWDFNFEPTILVGSITTSQIQDGATPTSWEITFQDRVLFVGTTEGPLRWAHQIFLPYVVK